MSCALGIDHGTSRTGLAITDELWIMAHPLETVQMHEHADFHGYIARIVAARGVTKIVIGHPVNMDGTIGPRAAEVRGFANKLRRLLPEVEIILWDERLTTRNATLRLMELGKNKRKMQKEVVDKMCAQIILQSWLDGETPMEGGGYGELPPGAEMPDPW